MEELNKLSEEYFKLNLKSKEIEEKKNTIKAEIKLILKTLSLDKYVTPNQDFISCYKSSRKTLDKSLVRKVILDDDVFESCFKISEIETLRIVDKDSYEKQKQFIK